MSLPSIPFYFCLIHYVWLSIRSKIIKFKLVFPIILWTEITFLFIFICIYYTYKIVPVTSFLYWHPISILCVCRWHSIDFNHSDMVNHLSSVLSAYIAPSWQVSLYVCLNELHFRHGSSEINYLTILHQHKLGAIHLCLFFSLYF